MDCGTDQQHVCLRPPQAESHWALPSGESKGASQEPRHPKAGLSQTTDQPLKHVKSTKASHTFTYKHIKLLPYKLTSASFVFRFKASTLWYTL